MRISPVFRRTGGFGLAVLLLGGATALVSQGLDLFAGISAYERSDYESAAAILDALDYDQLLDPERILAYKYLGATQLATGQTEAARESFIKLQEIDPEYSLDPGMFAPKVISTFQEARIVHATRLHKQGVEALRAEMPALAGELFARTLLLDPAHPTAPDYHSLALFKIEQGKGKTEEEPEDERDAPEADNEVGEETVSPTSENTSPGTAPAVPSTPPIIHLYVPGTACVYLAGQPPGTGVQGDEVPANSPVAVKIHGARSVTLRASGNANYVPRGRGPGPDGKKANGFSSEVYERFGISLLSARFASLVGVFISSSVEPKAPPRLTDSTNRPLLQQAFYIGSGPVTVQVPEGAETLHLGIHDGYGWSNNSGGFSVSVRLHGTY